MNFLLSLGPIGKIKRGSGTYASIATTFLIYLIWLSDYPNIITFITVSFFFILSMYLINQLPPDTVKKDPSWIVIDEFLGMLTASLFLLNDKLIGIIIILILFRVFDIFKPWPICLVDKKMCNALGIILDDLISGVFAGLIYILLALFFGL